MHKTMHDFFSNLFDFEKLFISVYISIDPLYFC